MDAGLTVEQGSHADLLCRRGCCYSLCNSQSSEALAQAAKLAALSMCSGMAGVERSLGGGAVVRLRLLVPLVYAR